MIIVSVSRPFATQDGTFTRSPFKNISNSIIRGCVFALFCTPGRALTKRDRFFAVRLYRCEYLHTRIALPFSTYAGFFFAVSHGNWWLPIIIVRSPHRTPRHLRSETNLDRSHQAVLSVFIVGTPPRVSLPLHIPAHQPLLLSTTRSRRCL